LSRGAAMNSRRLNWIISISLGAIFLFLWIRMVDWEAFIGYFHEFDLTMVLLFSGFYLLAYFLRSLRWRLIMKPIFTMGIIEAFCTFMAGMVINYLIPIRAGEVAKSIILKSKHEVRISQSLPTIFIDKISDLFPIILIMILIPLISVSLNKTLFIIIGLLFVIFLVFIVFLFFAVNHTRQAVKILHFMLRLIPRGYRPKLEEFFENFVHGMAVMQGRTGATIMMYVFTLGAVLSEAVYIYAVFHAFGSEISYTKILFGYTLMNLTYILPTPPAQIGSNQFMWVLIFSIALGVNKNLTSAAVTFSHLLTTIWIFFTGTISLLAIKIKFHKLVSSLKE
jgi:uncharacterized protein (TIRG00374 family)